MRHGFHLTATLRPTVFHKCDGRSVLAAYARTLARSYLKDYRLFSSRCPVPSSHVNENGSHNLANLRYASSAQPIAQREGAADQVTHASAKSYPKGAAWDVLPVRCLYSGRFWDGRRRITVPNEWVKLPERVMVMKPLKDPRSITASVFEWGAQYDPSLDQRSLYFRLLHVIANTHSCDEGWIAYCSLLEMQPPPWIPPSSPKIPFQHLHRLSRLISRARPKTRVQFLRLLSILYTIKSMGGQVKLFEWNALLDHASSRWRKTRIADFRFALNIFDDMISLRAPGESVAPLEFASTENASRKKIVPDIVTYTTLINIASETLDSRSLSIAISMLKASGIPSNRITQLALLKYFASLHDMAGFRSVILKMREEGHQLGIDGVNLVLWAYGQNDRIDLVARVYRVLRHQIRPDQYLTSDAIQEMARVLETEENLVGLTAMRPNEVTYTLIVQIMAYCGRFPEMSKVMLDMFTAENIEEGAARLKDSTGKEMMLTYSPTLAIFRAVFLGFFRHGVAEHEHPQMQTHRSKTWNLAQLRSQFEMFMSCEYDCKPSRGLFYWIIAGFAKTSDQDILLLRSIWTRLEERFGKQWLGENHRLAYLRAKLFSPDAESHFQRYGFRTAYNQG